ncbi:MAG: thiamine-phosphate kinase [Candidatus Omnitrophota bacterium]
MKTISEIGECGFIERIRRRYLARKNKHVVCGIGDDTAVLTHTKDTYLLFCSDMLIEDVHFTFNNTPGGFKVGWKALGVNISDIAAMGGTAKFCVVSLGIPRGVSIAFLDDFYRGLGAIAKKFSVSIVGGDTNRSDKFVVDIALIGEVKKTNLVLRSGAQVGDTILVTGSLGGSLYGRHLSFTPRIKESRFLVSNFKITSMIDISDGLAKDLSHIIKESKVGAMLYEAHIPISKNCKDIKHALSDGEDFELLFTMAPREAERLLKKRQRPFHTKISKIGTITKRRDGLTLVNKKGNIRKLKEPGFEHF